MDKSILKKFAIESREMLMTAVENQLKKYYVDEEFEKTQSGDLIILKNNNITLQPLTFDEFNKRKTLISRIKDLSEDGSIESGKKRVIEETAYTWFNRIVAIRYMELNDMLPLTKDNQSLGIRVLSSINNEPHPEILKLGNLTNTGLDLKIDFDKYNKLTNENEQFNYVLKLICNKLGIIIPQVFDGITDYIDLLLPENLLSDNGFVTKVIKEVSESNFKEGVEIIGWLYQYYNQTEKDRVINSRKQYKKDEIVYATQVFTPDWIVKYMVENTLGRYWIEHNGDNDLINNWKFFVKDSIENQKEKVKVTEIKFLDPCCGSGHILVYAFEVLYQIYRNQGYNKNDIPELILEDNLYGLDIDDRAGQLSILSILLKAREYDKDIFNKETTKKLNIYSIQETNKINKSDLNIIKKNNEVSEIVDYIYEMFLNAKEIGSLLILENRDYDKVLQEIIRLKDKQLNIFDIEKRKVINEKFILILQIAKILTEKYDIVVTNPPYLNLAVMSIALKKYVSEYFDDIKYDLFAVFIKRNSIFGKKNSYLGYMTPNVWMFITSYEELRKHIINNMNISTFLYLAKGSFFKEATVDIISFVLKNNAIDNNGTYYNLEKYGGDMESQEKGFLDVLKNSREGIKFSISKDELKNIPGYNIAFWCSKKMRDVFKKGKMLSTMADIVTGMSTGNNNNYLRLWYEIDINNISINEKEMKNIDINRKKWIPYNKGGDARKWYGNNEYVVKWSENKNFHRPRYTFENLYLKPGVTWSFVTTGMFSARYYKEGFLWDVAGSPCVIEDNKKLNYVLGFLSTKIVKNILKFINPTINCQVVDMQRLPIIIDESKIDDIDSIVKNSIEISIDDWDSFEISWDFIKHPLIEYKAKNGFGENDAKWVCKIKNSFESWKSNCEAKFNMLKQNEEKLNRIFINIYELQDELKPEVEDKDITIRLANREREIKSLISYAVGCMFGRYSLDEEGLIFAGGTFDKTRYKTFKVNLDNVIPITEEKYFQDDIVERFIHFIEVVYGKETLKENLDYVADTLGRKSNEDATDTIRRYFVNDFYKDHIKTYQKKPIYWMFESGKRNGFKCLIYMHRYDENLVAKIRLDYLYKTQRIYESRLQEIKTDLEDSNLSNYDAKKLEKEQESLQIKLEEIKKYNDKLSTIGDKRISIDLDDGVTENYKKFTYVDPITNKESSILAEENTIIPKKK